MRTIPLADEVDLAAITRPELLGKWVQAAAPDLSKSAKTKLWRISDLSGNTLGIVRWAASWRRYAFYPQDSTMFEAQCLRDIAQFCDQKTAEHKNK